MCHRLVYSHLLFPLSVSCDHFLKKKEERETGREREGGRARERERERDQILQSACGFDGFLVSAVTMVFVCLFFKEGNNFLQNAYGLNLIVSPLPPPTPQKKDEEEEEEEIRYYNVPVDSMVKPLSFVLIVPPSSTSFPPPPPPASLPTTFSVYANHKPSCKVQMEMINTLNILSKSSRCFLVYF